MSGLHGHLDLLAGIDEAGNTVLRRQSFAAPVHISKPHRDEGWLVVNMASPSPGLLAGDRVNVNVEVESGARILLTAPSANRIHTMAEGFAEVSQRFMVRAGGSLDVWPEYLIPQKDSAYRQKTRIEVEQGGTLLWTESIAPGRSAYGEVFEFRDMRISTDIILAERPIVRERYRIGSEHPSIHGLRTIFPQGYYASIVCIAPTAESISDSFIELWESLDTRRAWLGYSQLAAGASIVKVIAADSPTLRSLVAAARTLLQRAADIASPSLRRVTGEPSLTRTLAA